MPTPQRALSIVGLVAFALIAMAQAPFCPTPAATPTPTAPVATTKATTAATAAAPPKAASAAATQAATAAAKGAAVTTSVGWIHPANADEAKSLNIAPPYRSLGLVCASGLPPSAKAQVRLSGDAGPPTMAEGTVGADGKLEVRFPIQRAGNVTVEYASITPTSGSAPSPLPAGASGMVTLPANKPC